MFLSAMVWFALAILPGDLAPSGAHAQERDEEAWEYKNYLVTVWFSLDGSPELQPMLESLQQRLISQARLVDPVSWKLECMPAPSPWDRRIQGQMETVSGGDLCDRDDIKDRDKLTIVRIRRVGTSYEVSAREIDVYTRQWGAVVKQVVDDRDRLHWAVYKTVSQAFMPLCRINRVDNDKHFVDVSVRAVALTRRVEFNSDGTLINEPNTDSPAWVKPDDVLQPIVRRADRLHRVTDKTVKPVEWTYLTIVEHKGKKLTCYAHEGRRASLAGRSGYLIKKLALVIRPPKDKTRLRLVSQSDKKPLANYQVFEKNLDALDEEATQIGLTDWRGIIDIYPTDRNLRVLLIKNGNRPLARLPVIPGLYDERAAEMPDDEARLYAEGIINGLQTELLDIVARRQVFVAQIKKLIEDNKPAKAEELYKRLYELPNASNFGSKLSGQEIELRNRAASPREATKISQMFAKVKEQSDKRLQTAEVQRIMKYIEDLKKGLPVNFKDSEGDPDGLEDELNEAKGDPEQPGAENPQQ
jgi:hypothetical protein